MIYYYKCTRSLDESYAIFKWTEGDEKSFKIYESAPYVWVPDIVMSKFTPEKNKDIEFNVMTKEEVFLELL